LGWAVKLKSNLPFMGREALEAAHGKPLAKSLVQFTTERDGVVMLGRETILRDGKPVGYLSSGGFGYSVGKPVGLGYVRNADGVDAKFLEAGRYELVVAEDVEPARIHLAPLYDPQSARVKV
jgi:4-methylaminobutanoate oxidase (formaldehyde-forming)